MADNVDVTNAGVSRRKILIGAAWAAPAIAVASSAPAFAIGSGTTPVFTTSFAADRPSGGKGITYTLTVDSTAGTLIAPFTLTVTAPKAAESWTLNSGTGWSLTSSGSTTAIFTYTGPDITPGDSFTVVFTANFSNGSGLNGSTTTAVAQTSNTPPVNRTFTAISN